MQRVSDHHPGQDTTKASIDWVLDGISYYVVPLVIIVFTVLALWGGDARQAQPGEPLFFHVLEAPSEHAWTPEDARRELVQAPRVKQFNTRLSERPIWLFVPPGREDWSGRFIEFPSRHAQVLRCWDMATLTPVGSADRNQTVGGMVVFQAGFAVADAQAYARDGLLCRAKYSGPARVSVVARPGLAFTPMSQAFGWGAGLFEGGFITLALFTLLAAVVNRESRYMLLAVWLIGNLRLGAMSMGWDTQWLGKPVPAEWMHLVRQLTMAAYYIVTYTLFSQVFRKELSRLSWRLMGIVRSLCVLLLICAVVLPYRFFLPVMWPMVGVGASIIAVFLIRSIIRIRRRSALYYSAALATVLLASLSEVVAAAFDFSALLGLFNSVTAAVAASLMAAFAFADQLSAERADRLSAQEELQRTYHVTPVGLFTLDENGRFVRVNNAMIRMAGWAGSKVHVGQSWDACFGSGTFARLHSFAESMDGGETEIRVETGTSDEPVWYLVRVARAGSLIEGSVQNVTERRKLTERLRFLADNDFLTGVYNRRGIEMRLSDAIGGIAYGTAKPLTLAYLDLDRFKLINDLYGHQIGDEVLKQVCRRVGAIVAEHHDLGRIGGDEFILIMPDTSIDEARAQCQRIVESIADSHFHVRAYAFWVRVSVGLIEIVEHISVKDAISTADQACREAKKMSRSGRLVVYDRSAAVFRERAEELQIVEAMAESHLPKDLFLVMQPIMSLQDPHGSMDFEVLVRMRANDGHVVSVDRVLAAAEANGSVSTLDNWVLTNTLDWIRANRHRLDRTRFICVNLSGASLNDEAFMAEVFATLERYRDVADLLCLEITEGVAVHDIENGRRFIERLRQFGSRIALDDFGAGYTSFLYLKELPADALKIDGSFIRTLTHHPANVAILESIVQLAHNLGMRSIAEWVEDIGTLQTLAELGVDYAQGYLIARPMVPQALMAGASAADFVEDPQAAAFISEMAATGSLWEAAGAGDDVDVGRNGLPYH